MISNYFHNMMNSNNFVTIKSSDTLIEMSCQNYAQLTVIQSLCVLYHFDIITLMRIKSVSHFK